MLDAVGGLAVDGVRAGEVYGEREVVSLGFGRKDGEGMQWEWCLL
jgi:hypothetical protein